ncbi:MULTISPECIES: hypothetical protein [Ensifer]|uniref:hypothetical protein n=1 Tax=Ensifer TaxID=106591 RepID=UPI000713885B|nr:MULTISPECIES: hypothetical protein [Ensifer]KQX21781.1 hypothetical protein ASD01_29130 [Ensifer sp. Root423]QHG70105.1 hypothetical protein DQW09_09665 [Ensifer adhaerens]
MDDEEYNRRRHITFSQAEGIDPLPSQLRLGELSAAAKARLWAIFHGQIDRSTTDYGRRVGDPVLSIARRHWVQAQHRMVDEFDYRTSSVTENWKAYFHRDTRYDICLGFVQWMLRAFKSNQLGQSVTNALADTHVAYRVINGDTIMPVASQQEAEIVKVAVETADRARLPAARQHLLDAAAELSSGNYANSVRESMSAVESVAFTSTGETSFAKAIGVMDARRPMNGAFKIAINRLYDYTSQEPGIRHAKQEHATADVEEREAIFMLGVCASFVSYVLAE